MKSCDDSFNTLTGWKQTFEGYAINSSSFMGFTSIDDDCTVAHLFV